MEEWKTAKTDRKRKGKLEEKKRAYRLFLQTCCDVAPSRKEKIEVCLDSAASGKDDKCQNAAKKWSTYWSEYWKRYETEERKNRSPSVRKKLKKDKEEYESFLLTCCDVGPKKEY